MSKKVWRRVLDAVADDVDELVDAFSRSIVTDPVYARSTIPLSELREVDREGFLVLLDYLRDPQRSAPALERFASDLGRRRARDEIALESLMTAIRRDYGILWAALRDRKYGLPAEVLVEFGQRVWEAIEIYSARVQVEYSEARLAVEASSRERTFQRLRALFEEAAPTQADFARIARDLRIGEGSNFQLVALDREHVHFAVQSMHRRAGRRAFGYEAGHQGVLFWETDTGVWGGLSITERAALEGLRLGTAPVARGLAELREAFATAREVLSDLPTDALGPFGPLDRWRSLALHRLAGSGCDPRPIIHRRLERAPARERERILRTASIFMSTGSILATAARESCHRNTVINRLEAFAQYTEVDLREPSGAALGALVLLPNDE